MNIEKFYQHWLTIIYATNQSDNLVDLCGIGGNRLIINISPKIQATS